VTSNGLGPAAVTLLSNGELDALALGKADPRLFTANDAVIRLAFAHYHPTQEHSQDVALTGGELVVHGILDVHNVEASVVALTVGNDTDTTHVVTASDHDNDCSVELDEVGDLASSEVNLDGVIDLDGRVGVTDPISLSIFFSTLPETGLVLGAEDLSLNTLPKLCPTADRGDKLTFARHA
jgi:hypothetical protein